MPASIALNYVYSKRVFPSFSRLAEGNYAAFFSNIAAGGTILRITESFPRKKVTVLAGHTHCAAGGSVAANLEVKTGAAKPGFPEAAGMLRFCGGKNQRSRFVALQS